VDASVREQPESQRASRRERRALDILAAARQELTEKGYDGVTMDALAERAGVVKKTLYNRYGSKDRLLVAAISQIIQGYRGSAIEERGIPAIVASRNAAARQVVATPEYAEAMTRALMQAEPGHVLVQLLLEDAVAELVRHLRAARAKGELEPFIDIQELAEQVASHGWGLILLWIKGLVPLAEFETRSMRGLFVMLRAATRGSRRRLLGELLDRMPLPERRGFTP
jgi:AcrR family transcriptional regulator